MKNRLFRRLILMILTAALSCAGCAAAENVPESARDPYVLVTPPPAFIPDPGAGYVPEWEIGEKIGFIASRPLIACSGAGAWYGEIQIERSGRISGYYYDADFDVIYFSRFSGTIDLSRTLRYGDGNCLLWLEEIAPENTPGTLEEGDDGETVEYTAPPFDAQSWLLLTMPGTPDGEIPETVRAEIGGTDDVWEGYSGYVTLTREDGWGFFAETGPMPR